MPIAIVTGASGNLGKAVVEKYTDAGFSVFGTGNWSDAPIGYKGVKVNLADEQAAADWIHEIIEEAGVPDTVIMTVGGFAMGDIASTSLAGIKEQLSINVDTAYNVARPVLESMKKTGKGTLFFIGSMAGYAAPDNKGVVAYGLAKSLLFRLSELINLETAGTAIKSFVVVPTIIDTPQNRAAMPDADFTKWQSPASIAATIKAASENPQTTSSVIIS